MLIVYILILRFSTAYYYPLPNSVLLVKMVSYPTERIWIIIVPAIENRFHLFFPPSPFRNRHVDVIDKIAVW
jgi:hypothetical protein